MNDLRYILNMPIEIEDLGRIYAFTMEEYTTKYYYLNVLSITINLVLQGVDDKDIEKRQWIENNMKIFEVICHEEELIDSLLKLLEISFKPTKIEKYPFWKRVLNTILNRSTTYLKPIKLKYNSELQRIYINDGFIDKDNYDYIRSELIKVNNIHISRQAKTKELAKWLNKSNKLKNIKNKNAGDMEDIITCIMAMCRYTPEDIKKMTLYQVNKLIARLNKINNYKAQIQFLCAGSDSKTIEHWSDKIEEKIDEMIDFNSFASQMKSFE